jgi:rubredoxin
MRCRGYDGRKITLKQHQKGANTMEKWRCIPCDYIYDPEEGDPEGGIPAGTNFEDLPDDWECPICGVGKDEFEKVE